MRRLLLTTAAASLVMLTACSEWELGSNAFADTGSGTGERVRLLTGAGALGSAAGDVRLIGGDIDSTLDTADSARVAGADVRLTGQVGGALEIAAAELVLDDVTAGSLDAAAADMRFSGSVSGPTRIRAADLQFDGRAGPIEAQLADAVFRGAAGEMTIQAADLVLDRGFTAASLHADVADFMHRGSVQGDLDVQAHTAVLDGPVLGELALYADPGRRPHGRDAGRVEISGAIADGFICARTVSVSGPVSGALTILADEQPSLSGAALTADITYSPRNGDRCERGMED